MKLFQNMTFIALVLFLYASTAMAQPVSNKATDAFNRKFPDAQQIEWGMEGSDVYEAEFTLRGTKMSANFDANGNWKETETAISQDQLPDAVKQILNQKFNNADVKRAYQVEKANRTVYEVEVKNNQENEMNEEGEESEKHGEMEENEKSVHELVFTKDGKLVKKEKGGEES